MALLTFVQEATEPKKKAPPSKRKQKQSSNNKKQQKPPSSSSSSWDQIKNLLTCKQIEGTRVHDPSKTNIVGGAAGGYSKLGSSCSSICSFRDVVHGNTRVVHRADNSPESSTLGQETGLLGRKLPVTRSSTRSSSGSTRSNATGGAAAYTTSSSSRGMQFRKLSGCYECHMIVDPSRYVILLHFGSKQFIYTQKLINLWMIKLQMNFTYSGTQFQGQLFVLALSAERSSRRWIVWNITKQFAMLVLLLSSLLATTYIIFDFSFTCINHFLMNFLYIKLLLNHAKIMSFLVIGNFIFPFLLDYHLLFHISIYMLLTFLSQKQHVQNILYAKSARNFVSIVFDIC